MKKTILLTLLTLFFFKGYSDQNVNFNWDGCYKKNSITNGYTVKLNLNTYSCGAMGDNQVVFWARYSGVVYGPFMPLSIGADYAIFDLNQISDPSFQVALDRCQTIDFLYNWECVTYGWSPTANFLINPNTSYGAPYTSLSCCPPNDCIADFSVKTSTDMLEYPEYYYVFDDEDLSYLNIDLNNFPCECNWGINYDYGEGIETFYYENNFKVTDEWTINDGTNITTYSFNNIDNPLNYTGLDQKSITHIFNNVGNAQICHTKTIELGCKRKRSNPFNAITHPTEYADFETMVPAFYNCTTPYNCTVCLDICMNNPTYEINNEDNHIENKQSSKIIDVNNNSIKAYPVPASNSLNIELTSINELNESQIEVVDIHGKIILSNKIKVSKGKNEFTIDITSIQSGMYFVFIKSENKIFKHKFIIQK